jgi:HK97 family phage major capsid protein
MNKNTEKLFAINTRKAEIRSLVETNAEGIDLDALETELRSLDTEFSDIEKRMKFADGITISKPTEGDNIDMITDTYTVASPEYRSAWLKKLQGNELTDVEKRAMTISTAGAAIPTTTHNEILKKIKERAPLLADITLLEVPAGVTYAVEGVNNEASLHAEGTTITGSEDTLVEVTLGSYEITKLVSISKSVSKMAIDAFETWLTDNLAEAVANKITAYLIVGTGSGQPQGMNTAQTWDETNSVTVASGASLAANNVQSLIGLLGAGYDAGAKFYMSKKTLFSDFMPLQDSAKHNLVVEAGGKYYIYGYEVTCDDRIPNHEAFLGNLKKAIVGNLSEVENVVSQFDINTNSYKYLGCALFDSKVAIDEAIVKLVKAA